MQKLFFIILFIFSSLFFQFCDNSCGKKNVSRMVIKDYNLNRAFKLDGMNKKLNFTIDSIPVKADDTVYLTLIPELKTVNLYPVDGELYACDPVFPATEPLGDSLKIFAIDEFDATHPAGSDVSNFFRIFMPEYNSAGEIAVRQYIPLSGFSLLSQWKSQITLALIKKPTSSGIRFKAIVYKQSVADGKVTEWPVLGFF